MITLVWSSPRSDDRRRIRLMLDLQAAIWLAEHLPLNDAATMQLLAAIRETEKDAPEVPRDE